MERDFKATAGLFYRYISTHTLTWSVTLYEIKLKELRKFQLTRSRGAWQPLSSMRKSQGKFQLTRSRGAWLLIPLTALHASEFQLTRSRGAWHNSAVSLAWEWKFQLTRSRGAWPIRIQGRYGWMSISTHTLTWSVTRGKSSRVVRWTNFNSHAHVERDINNNNLNTIRFISTHTLTWSVTPT